MKLLIRINGLTYSKIKQNKMIYVMHFYMLIMLFMGRIQKSKMKNLLNMLQKRLIKNSELIKCFLFLNLFLKINFITSYSKLKSIMSLFPPSSTLIIFCLFPTSLTTLSPKLTIFLSNFLLFW